MSEGLPGAYEKLEEWELKLLDEENQPELYDTLEVLELRDKLKSVAKAAVIIYALNGLFSFPIIRMFLLQLSVSVDDLWQTATDLLNLFIRIAVIYFPLKALEQILRILMEMEFNSRKAT